MATIILVNLFIFLIVSGIGIFKGLDLKKWPSWSFALYGFLSGFLCGFLGQDQSGSPKLIVNWTGSLEFGALLAFVVMYTGAMNRWHRSWAERGKNLAEKRFEEELENLAAHLFKDKHNGKSGNSK